MLTFLADRIASTRARTALLEACEWDDDVADAVISELDESVRAFSGSSIEQLVSHVRQDLRRRHADEVVKNVIALLRVEVGKEIRELQVLRGEA
jgi:hypothetical protein